MNGGAARVFRDFGAVVALAGLWLLLWVSLVTARHEWGPDMGGIAGLFLGGLGLGALAIGVVIAAVAGAVAARAGGGAPSGVRIAVTASLAGATLVAGLFVASVWAKRLLSEHAEDARMRDATLLQGEDRTRRAALWDANQSSLLEGVQRCVTAAEPPPGIEVSGVLAAEREVLASRLHADLPAYRLVTEREIACVRSVVFPERLSGDGEARVAKWALAGRFEGDDSPPDAGEIVALATKTSVLELDPILFHKGAPPLVERRDWPGRPAVLLGRVRRTLPPQAWPPPDRSQAGRLYDAVVLAFLERPLSGPTVPIVRLRWIQVRVVRGIDDKEYVAFDTGAPRGPAATPKPESARP